MQPNTTKMCLPPGLDLQWLRWRPPGLAVSATKMPHHQRTLDLAANLEVLKGAGTPSQWKSEGTHPERNRGGRAEMRYSSAGELGILSHVHILELFHVMIPEQLSLASKNSASSYIMRSTISHTVSAD